MRQPIVGIGFLAARARLFPAKQTKKEPACSVVEQAGVLIDRVIDGRKPKGEIRSRNSRAQDTDGTGQRGKLFGNKDAEHRTPRTDVGRADVGIKSRRNGRRRNGVCQTPATAKKKKPDGFQNWLHVHNACWRIGQHDSIAMLGQGEQT